MLHSGDDCLHTSPTVGEVCPTVNALHTVKLPHGADSFVHRLDGVLTDAFLQLEEDNVHNWHDGGDAELAL
jgi:hypothetical protein